MKILKVKDKRKKSKVPIVIPNYNKALYLKEALESVCNQTLRTTVYFYDDGSTDDSVDIAKEYKTFRGLGSSLKIFGGNQNKGVASVVNTLANMLISFGYEYMCIVASDDIVKPEFLEKLEAEIPTNFVTCNAQMFGIENRVFKSYPDVTLEDYKNDSKILTAGMYSLNMWKELGGRREDWRLTHDYEFFVRMLKNGYDYKVVDEELYLWRNYQGQLSRTVADDNDLRKKAYEINNLTW